MKVPRFMKPHEEWLYKAGNDLESAKYLLTSEKKLFDIIVYHCQQSAEKALKAFLSYRNHKIDKTHSLIILTELCESYESTFTSLREAVSYLNPYSTVYRYPTDVLLPSLRETEKAIENAEIVYSFVGNLLAD